MLDIISRLFNTFFSQKAEVSDDYKNRYNNYMKRIISCENADEKVKVIKNILSVIINYLNFDEAVQTIETEHEAQNNASVEGIYYNIAYEIGISVGEIICEKLNSDNMKYYRNQKMRTEGPISIGVNELPILLNPWNPDRIIRNLDNINEQNIFDGDRYSFNIYNHYLYPMDIVICNGGNHSQFSARMKHQGHTLIKGIYDYSELYKHVYFDGRKFKRKSDDSDIDLEYNKKLVFYSGVIFEYGRHLLECTYRRFQVNE